MLYALFVGDDGHVGLQQDPLCVVLSETVSLSQCCDSTVVLPLVLIYTDRTVSVLQESLGDNQR